MRETGDRTYRREGRGKPANWRAEEESNHMLQTKPRKEREHRPERLQDVRHARWRRWERLPVLRRSRPDCTAR